MKKNVLYAALLALYPLCTSAFAGYSVPAGCTTPATFKNQWYVDPINGSDAGDGSQAKPWKTLQTVFSSGMVGYQTATKFPWVIGEALKPIPASAVVQPGDVIWLASGDHGSVTLRGAFNSSFIAIKALPGATPVLHNFSIVSGSHWIVDGITLLSLNPTPGKLAPYLLSAMSTTYFGTLDNIIFNGNILQSQADVSSWLPVDWRNKVSSGIRVYAGWVNPDGTTDYNGVYDGTCFAVTNNKISNIGTAMAVQQVDHVLISGNIVNNLVDDGLDYSFSDAVVTRNIMTNFIDDGDGMHRDAMQGQAYWGEQTYNHDIVFSNNNVVQQTNNRVPYPACIQGINTFDGKWHNITAYGNSLFISNYHGLIFYGVDGATIANNTVLSVSAPTSCTLSADAPLTSAPASAGPPNDTVLNRGFTWIGTHDGKDGTPSTNIVIRNNIASTYSLSATGTHTFDHNIVAGTNQKIWIPLPTGAVAPVIVDPNSLFVHFKPSTYSTNIRPAPGSPSIGTGIVVPVVTSPDLYGAARKSPPDIGMAAFVAP